MKKWIVALAVLALSGCAAKDPILPTPGLEATPYREMVIKEVKGELVGEELIFTIDGMLYPENVISMQVLVEESQAWKDVYNEELTFSVEVNQLRVRVPLRVISKQMGRTLSIGMVDLTQNPEALNLEVRIQDENRSIGHITQFHYLPK